VSLPLFEKFVTKSAKGTGLGLYISNRIIQAHGGKMWAENNADGKGATFAFRLPLEKEHQEEPLIDMAGNNMAAANNTLSELH
jgi:signal transduction histidine kinase